MLWYNIFKVEIEQCHGLSTGLILIFVDLSSNLNHAVHKLNNFHYIYNSTLEVLGIESNGNHSTFQSMFCAWNVRTFLGWVTLTGPKLEFLKSTHLKSKFSHINIAPRMNTFSLSAVQPQFTAVLILAFSAVEAKFGPRAKWSPAYSIASGLASLCSLFRSSLQHYQSIKQIVHRLHVINATGRFQVFQHTLRNVIIHCSPRFKQECPNLLFGITF